MQSSNIAQPRDDSTKTLHDYFNNNYYKNLITLSLILMFAIVFYLIYLIIDSLIDKNYHQFMSVEAYERYEARKQKSKKKSSLIVEEIDVNENEAEKMKRKISERTRKIEFTSWSHRNLQLSFIHSVLCSLWLIRIIAYRNTELFNDLLGFVSWDTYLLLAFSCGYFLYDFYDIYANGHIKIEWVVCVHHGIVLLTFGYHMINLVNIGYTVVALFMEFNSVFLHARKLLRFYNFKPDSLIVRVNSILNILTFVFFRFGVLLAIVAGIYYDGKRVTLRYLIMLSSCSFVMAIINVVLFKRILTKDWLTCKKQYANNTDNINHLNKNSNGHFESVNLLEVEKVEHKVFNNGDIKQTSNCTNDICHLDNNMVNRKND